jgi:hypothetical protein
MSTSTSACGLFAVIEDLIELLFGGGSPPPTSSTAALLPPLLREPNLEVRPVAGGRFAIGKPTYGLFDTTVRPDAAFTKIQEFASEAAARAAMEKLPRVRLPAKLTFSLEPGKPLERLSASEQLDWSSDADAVRLKSQLDALSGPSPLFASFSSLKFRVMQAKLRGIEGIHLEDPDRPGESLILLDPFQTPGLLAMAANLVHELTHARQFQDRGFLVQDTAPQLSKDEFCLLYLEDEFDCYVNTGKFVEESLGPHVTSEPFLDNFPRVLETGSALYLLRHESRFDTTRALHEVRRETILVYADNADSAHSSASTETRGNQAAVTAWLSGAEWAAIKSRQHLWDEARSY